MRATDLATKREIAKVFFSMPSPRIISTAAAVAVLARLTFWSWGLGDLLVIGGVFVFTGPLEWVIHVLLLHSRSDSFQARRLGAGASHRQHHLDPPELQNLLLNGVDAAAFTVLLALATLVWALPIVWLAGVAIWPSLLTAVVATYLGFANYEWTHLMVHTRYRPRTRFYARLARNHRLHHFRNEQYWLGVTSNLGDRMMRTLPTMKTDVPLSDTARTLD